MWHPRAYAYRTFEISLSDECMYEVVVMYSVVFGKSDITDLGPLRYSSLLTESAGHDNAYQ